MAIIIAIGYLLQGLVVINTPLLKLFKSISKENLLLIAVSIPHSIESLSHFINKRVNLELFIAELNLLFPKQSLADESFPLIEASRQ